MRVIRARALGMCFGVRDALQAAREVQNPAATTIYGELVHNPRVQEELAARGFHSLSEAGRAVPPTPGVLITAHGISEAERSLLEASGKSLVDTTCPLVHRAHGAAQLLAQQGYFVVVLGKRTHVEVLGITGDLTRYDVAGSLAEVRKYDEPNIGVVCQTTTPPDEAEALLARVRELNPESKVRFLNTICRPTRERQEAMKELLEAVDAVVVVGGKHSNNTLQLVRLAASRGLPVQHVESAAELDLDMLMRFEVVGLAAGTSTLDSTIDEVQQALEAVGVARCA